jgi:hypothetical protein
MSGKIRAAFAVALAAAGLTGCAGMNGYSVRDETAGQREVIGDVVHLGATLCLDDEAPARDSARLALPEQGDGTCDPVDPQVNYAMGFSLHAGVQFFTGFLVPAGASAPATASATLPAAFMPRAVTLTRKPSLDETLETTRPAPAGQRWVGYISPVVGAAAVGGEQPSDVRAGLRALAEEEPTPAPDGDGTGGDWTAAADFTITRGDGGLPAPASFTHAVLGGVRMAYPDAIYDGVDPLGPYLGPDDHFGLQLLASRPVDCQELRGFPYARLLGVPLDGTDEDPDGLPLLQTTLCGRSSAGAELALKDLRGSGGEASVAPGGTATVPFTLRYAGDAGPAFALSATTAVPGATVAPTPSTLTPSGAGFQDARVAVTVPAGTAPGAYAVTLTATVAGQARTAQGTLTVTAPAGGAPRTAAASGDDDADDAPVSAASATTTPARARQLEFRGFDRSGVGPDGRSVNLGDVLCHKADAGCDWVTVQLIVRWEQLHAGAEIARASARQRVRMVTIGATTLSVPAQGRRHVKVTLPSSVRKLLASGEILHAVAAVRPARNRVPIVHRIALRRG